MFAFGNAEILGTAPKSVIPDIEGHSNTYAQVT